MPPTMRFRSDFVKLSLVAIAMILPSSTYADSGAPCADVNHSGAVDVIDVVHVINVAFRGGDSNLVCPDRLDSAAVVHAWFETALAVITDSVPGEAAVRPLLDDLSMRIINRDPSAPDAILDFAEAMDAQVANNTLSPFEANSLMAATLAFWPIAQGHLAITADALVTSANGLAAIQLTLNRCVDREPNGEGACVDAFVADAAEWIDPSGTVIAIPCSDQCKNQYESCRASYAGLPETPVKDALIAGCALKLLICNGRCALLPPNPN